MAELVTGIVVPFAVEGIKAMCQLIKKKLQKRKERKQAREDITSQSLKEDMLQQDLDTLSLKEDMLPKDLDTLSSKVRIFGGLIQASPDRQDQLPQVQEWLEELKETLYDAEDLLDEYATDIAIREMDEADEQENPKAQTTNIDQSDFAIQIKNIIVKLEDLAKTKADLEIRVVPEPKQNEMRLEWRDTTSTPDQHPIMGRDDDARSIKHALSLSNKNQNQPPTMLASAKVRLVETVTNILSRLQLIGSKNQNQQPSLSVLPIIGMGGIGKTTLARLLYNDPNIKSSFSLKAWVCVSNNFHRETIIRNTVSCIDEQGEYKYKEMRLQNLEQAVLKLVEGKSLFLVLDDIWNKEKSEWDSLLKPFQEGCKVSRGITIIITTRFSTTDIRGAIPTCIDPFHVEGLNENDMWELVKHHAFANYGHFPGSDHRAILEDIGKGILPKLKGSPLAAKTIGTLLDSKHTVDHWRNIVYSELHTLEQNKDDIIPILTLSYDHLPRHLKQCLIYFSLFPKDHKFEKMDMVHFWIAYNCIQCAANKDVEDVGKEYFDLLVNRSFLEPNDDDDDDDDDFDYDNLKYGTRTAKTYLMHDLIHDLVQTVSKFDCYWIHGDSSSEKGSGNPKGVRRHVSIFLRDNLDCVDGNALPIEKLRTFICAGSFNIQDISRMKRLRVLALRQYYHQALSDEMEVHIGSLKHLRVLILSDIEMSEVPKFLGRLHNLQVLILYDCEGIQRLPRTMTRLVNLRHLITEIDNKKIFEKAARILQVPGFGRLSSLRSLPSYRVNSANKLGINELKDLNMLQGKFSLESLECLKSREEAEQACLYKKERLRGLTFEWSEETTTTDGATQEEVLEGLKPCKQLKEINIINYMGGKLPGWMSELSWLEQIMLLFCEKITMLPPCLGTMPFLKKLGMVGLTCLKEIKWHREDLLCKEDGVLFPALQKLYLCELPECVGWWIEEKAGSKQDNEFQTTARNFPQLEYLMLYNCPNLKCLAVLTSLLEKEVTEAGPPPAAIITPTPRSSLRVLDIGGLHGMDDALLSALLFKGLTSLEELTIKDCPKITSCRLPETIRRIKIHRCESLTSCCGTPALTDLESLSAITSSGSGLVLLEYIELTECPLLSLPDLRSATSLRSLTIINCPKLKEKYKKRMDGTGNNINPHWNDISHIPNVWIE